MKMVYMVLRGEDLVETFSTGAEAEAFAIKLIKEYGPWSEPVRVMGVPEDEEDEN